MTSWDIFRVTALQAFCAGNSPVTGEFPTQRPLTQSFDVFYDFAVFCVPRPTAEQTMETPVVYEAKLEKLSNS